MIQFLWMDQDLVYSVREGENEEREEEKRKTEFSMKY